MWTDSQHWTAAKTKILWRTIFISSRLTARLGEEQAPHSSSNTNTYHHQLRKNLSKIRKWRSTSSRSLRRCKTVGNCILDRSVRARPVRVAHWSRIQLGLIEVNPQIPSLNTPVRYKSSQTHLRKGTRNLPLPILPSTLPLQPKPVSLYHNWLGAVREQETLIMSRWLGSFNSTPQTTFTQLEANFNQLRW